MLEIIAYFFSIIIIYNVLKSQYYNLNFGGKRIKIYSISWANIIFFTLLIIGVNYCYTELLGIGLVGDRVQYRYGYNNDISPSAGLLFLFSLAKFLGLDFTGLALLITGLSVPFVFISYKVAKGASPTMMLFFLLTPNIINGFDSFKQAFANSFACLLFALFTRNQSFSVNFFCLLLIILAFTFHPSGFILILFYLIFKIDIKFKNYWGVFIILFIITLLLKPILLTVASVLGNFVPFLTDKIHQYFDEDTLQSEGRIIVALKGIVYFFITFQVLHYKKKLQKTIPNFSFNLIICIFACFLYLLSYHNVWMTRMVALFVFPIMLFWVKCINCLPNKNINKLITCVLTGFFTFRLMWLSVVSPPQ